MKIWTLLQINHNHGVNQGFDLVLGVFSSKEKAEEAQKNKSYFPTIIVEAVLNDL